MKTPTRLLAATALAAAAWALRSLPAQFGGRARGARAERVAASPQFRDGAFRNRRPTSSAPDAEAGGGLLRDYLFGEQVREPRGPIPLASTRRVSETGLFVTWFGHSSALVEIDGVRVLFDPVWSDRASPVPFAGPKRLHEPPLPLSDLPPVDAVVISHDHYDHLDMSTVKRLCTEADPSFIVPLGVGAHLERWGVPPSRIVELDWSEEAEVRGVRVVSTPAQHFSGRGFRRDGTLWSSYALIGPEHRVFYSGDTGYFPGFADIGAEHGPFDASLVQVGAYNSAWPDIHMTPEQGVATHLDVRAGLLLPVHWGTFKLAVHDWTEPVDRLWAEAKARGVSVAVPRPGQRVDVSAPPPVEPWWQLLGD